MQLDLKTFQHSDKADQLGLNNSLPEDLKQEAAAFVEWFNQSVAPLMGIKQFNSGYRTDALNRAVKGAKGSQHTKAQAIDFVPDVDLDEAMRLIQESGITYDQVIREPSWIHVSHKQEGNRQASLLKTKQGYAPYKNPKG